MRPRAAAPGPGGAHRQGHGGVWTLAVLAPIWGYGWVVSKVALEYSAPLTFAAIYLPLSTGCLFLVLAVTHYFESLSVAATSRSFIHDFGESFVLGVLPFPPS